MKRPVDVTTRAKTAALSAYRKARREGLPFTETGSKHHEAMLALEREGRMSPAGPTMLGGIFWVEVPLPKLTRVQRLELRAIGHHEDHQGRPGPRNKVRNRLERMGLIRWYVDPKPTARRNRSAWLLTDAGRAASNGAAT